MSSTIHAHSLYICSHEKTAVVQEQTSRRSDTFAKGYYDVTKSITQFTIAKTKLI